FPNHGAARPARPQVLAPGKQSILPSVQERLCASEKYLPENLIGSWINFQDEVSFSVRVVDRDPEEATAHRDTPRLIANRYPGHHLIRAGFHFDELAIGNVFGDPNGTLTGHKTVVVIREVQPFHPSLTDANLGQRLVRLWINPASNSLFTKHPNGAHCRRNCIGKKCARNGLPLD